MESRARCAGFSVTEIGNRKERLRVREAGASAAGRGQRPYASFPDESLSGGFKGGSPNVTLVPFFLNACSLSAYEKSGQKTRFFAIIAVPSLPRRSVGQFAVGIFLFQIINDPDAAVCA